VGVCAEDMDIYYDILFIYIIIYIIIIILYYNDNQLYTNELSAKSAPKSVTAEILNANANANFSCQGFPCLTEA